MEIMIIKDLGNAYVQAQTEYGVFVGKWVGKNIQINEKVCVEIEYGKIINYRVIEEKYFIGNNNGKNIICGKIIDLGDNSVQYLEIDDCTMMLRFNEEIKNKFIEIEVDEIQLYPVYY
ncbi:MAG: hypothetical protein LBU73_02320 [Helicobacteraceae bacterium]|jgi:hypothetical protein|nr:hypothetical protein [Helicobacteraceae bacterium]